jgi:hypothetical protein
MFDTDVEPWRLDRTKRRRLSEQLKGTSVGYQAGKSRRLHCSVIEAWAANKRAKFMGIMVELRNSAVGVYSNDMDTASHRDALPQSVCLCLLTCDTVRPGNSDISEEFSASVDRGNYDGGRRLLWNVARLRGVMSKKTSAFFETQLWVRSRLGSAREFILLRKNVVMCGPVIERSTSAVLYCSAVLSNKGIRSVDRCFTPGVRRRCVVGSGATVYGGKVNKIVFRQNRSVQNYFAKGPQPWLWASSRAQRMKFVVSGTTNSLTCCAVCL